MPEERQAQLTCHCVIPQDHVSLLSLTKNTIHLPSSCMIIDIILARVCLFTAKAKDLQIAKNVVNELLILSGCRYRNESGIGISSLEWYPDTEVESERDAKAGLYFADKEGYIGWFQGAGPVGGRGSGKEAEPTDDPLADDSLLMEGIPPDAIFGTDDIMDDKAVDGGHDNEDETVLSGSHSNTAEEDDDIIQSRKRRRLLEDSDGETDSIANGTNTYKKFLRS